MTQKINTHANFKQTMIKGLLIAFAVIIAFLMFIQVSPTIANAQATTPASRNPTPRTPADNTSPTRNATNSGNGGKPINVCGVISTCPAWIESYKSQSNTPESLAKSVVKFILTFVYFAIYIASAVAVAFIVLAGYRYITSQGDEKNTKAALDILKNAVIGLVLAVLSLTIVTFIGNFLTNFNF
jgi:Type IV secretion system pilin